MKLRLDILVDMAFHLALDDCCVEARFRAARRQYATDKNCPAEAGLYVPLERQSRTLSFRAASIPEKSSLAILP
jgi:hypothetical protein